MPLLLCFALLSAALPATAAVDVTQRVTATGLAAVTAGNTAAAAEAARRAALRQAVEQGVGVLVSSATRVQDYAVIDDRILSSTTGYVRRYEVVEEHADAEGGYHVTIDAVVDLGRLQGDLAALDLAALTVGRPRVACIASESFDGDPVDWRVTGAALYAVVAGMSEMIEVVPADASADSQAVDIVVRAEAAATATQAPIPLSRGRAVSASGLATATATLRVDIGWVDEDQPVGVLRGSGRGAAASPRGAAEAAIEQAVEGVTDSLRALLAEDLRARAYSARFVDLIVESPRVAADLAGLTRDLESGLGPVQSLTPRRVDGPVVNYRVRSASGAFDLARHLSARGLGGDAVEILQVTPNRLRVSLQAPPGEGS